MIQHLGFLGIPGRHSGQSAVRQHILRHQADHIDGKNGRCIHERILRGHVSVTQHRRQARLTAIKQIPTYEEDGYPRGAEILLGPGVNQTEAGHVQRPAEEIGRHVANQRYGAGIWNKGVLRPNNGVVARVMDIHGVWVAADIGRGWQAIKV
jgi:hypothetical protein